MISNRRNSYVFKGDDYCFSHLKTVDKKQRCYPWVCSYFSDKLRELSFIKCGRYLYHKETALFMLIAWTIVTITLLILVALSEFIIITNALLFVMPAFICFVGYLWAGLFLKYYMLTFSLGTCLIGCLILEVLIELLAVNGLSEITRSLGTVSFILSFTVMFVGICIMKDSHITTWVLLSTFIMARVTFQMILPPVLVYICILGGKHFIVFVHIMFHF